MASAQPAPLRLAPPQGGNGSPSHDANMNNQNMVNKQMALNKSVSGGSRRRTRSSGRRYKRGGDAVPVSTINPRYTNTMGGDQNPNAIQMNNAKMANQQSVQSRGDAVPLVTKGGKRKRMRRSRRSRKSRRTRRTRRTTRKSRR
jgi:hypothetical protein